MSLTLETSCNHTPLFLYFGAQIIFGKPPSRESHFYLCFKEIFLYNDQYIPAPLYYWKVLQDKVKIDFFSYKHSFHILFVLSFRLETQLWHFWD